MGDEMKRDIIVMFLTVLMIICGIALRNREWFIAVVSVFALIGWGWLYGDVSGKFKKGV